MIFIYSHKGRKVLMSGISIFVLWIAHKCSHLIDFVSKLRCIIQIYFFIVWNVIFCFKLLFFTLFCSFFSQNWIFYSKLLFFALDCSKCLLLYPIMLFFALNSLFCLKLLSFALFCSVLLKIFLFCTKLLCFAQDQIFYSINSNLSTFR